MCDTYTSFSHLAKHERKNKDYRLQIVDRPSRLVIIAPHGGGVEPGTSEIAQAIAGEEFSFYAFEGIKPRHNSRLHVTSTHFGEPKCVELVRRSEIVVAIHGEKATRKVVFVGGLDARLSDQLRESMLAKEFIVEKHRRRTMQGIDSSNICNQGATRQGVQLELSNALRRSFFKSFSKAGRRTRTRQFDNFVCAVRGVLLSVFDASNADLAS